MNFLNFFKGDVKIVRSVWSHNMRNATQRHFSKLRMNGMGNPSSPSSPLLPLSLSLSTLPPWCVCVCVCDSHTHTHKMDGSAGLPANLICIFGFPDLYP